MEHEAKPGFFTFMGVRVADEVAFKLRLKEIKEKLDVAIRKASDGLETARTATGVDGRNREVEIARCQAVLDFAIPIREMI